MKLGPVTALKNKNALMRWNTLHKRWCTACCILQLLLPWTGCFPVFQVAQSPIYTGLEHFLEWGKFSGQPVPVSHHPCSKGFLPATSLSPSSLSLQPGCLKTGSIPEPSIADRLCAQDIHCRSPGSWTFLSVRWELRHFLFLKLSVGQGPPTPLSSCFLLTLLDLSITQVRRKGQHLLQIWLALKHSITTAFSSILLASVIISPMASCIVGLNLSGLTKVYWKCLKL